MADTTFVDYQTVIPAAWLNDVNDLTYGIDDATGAGLVGFNHSTLYAASTAGWGIRSSVTDYNILRDIPVAEWAAVLDGTTTVDHSSILQTRINALAAADGGCIFIPGTLLCNTPIILKSTVSLRGNCNGNLDTMSRIKKDSTTTAAVTVIAGSLVVYEDNGGVIPSNVNAIIVLTDNGSGSGRYQGSITGLHLEGTLSTPGNYETQKVEFGIVSLGSVSESLFEHITITSTKYGLTLPIIFVSQISRVTFQTCLYGLGINNGTSTNITNCYANNCRNWGYFIRDHKYSLISGNACDSLNDPAKYPTRTRECSAYRLRSTLGVVVCGNGDELTYGNSYYLETFVASEMYGNLSIGIGSDYVGAEQIAWIKTDSELDASSIYNNHAYSVKGTGLTSGGASAGAHHNIYAASPTSVFPHKFQDNVVADARSTMLIEAGWGNNSLAATLAPVTITAVTHSMICTDVDLIANRAGTITLSLPTPSLAKGKEINIRTIQAQAVDSAASDVVPLIGGAAGTSILAATDGRWARLKCDGTNWQIMAAN